MQESANPQPIVPRLIRTDTIPGVEHTPGGILRVLHGDEQGLGEISLLFSYNPPGGGPAPHFHDYVEIFVVQSGKGVYQVGSEVFEAEVGDLVVVPPGLVHSFRATEDGTLIHVAVHQAAHGVTKYPG